MRILHAYLAFSHRGGRGRGGVVVHDLPSISIFPSISRLGKWALTKTSTPACFMGFWATVAPLLNVLIITAVQFGTSSSSLLRMIMMSSGAARGMTPCDGMCTVRHEPGTVWHQSCRPVKCHMKNAKISLKLSSIRTAWSGPHDFQEWYRPKNLSCRMTQTAQFGAAPVPSS